MPDAVHAPCLGCGRVFAVPVGVYKMAERYGDEGKIVLFCSRKCNMSFVEKEGKRGQERKMRELIERLEKKTQ